MKNDGIACVSHMHEGGAKYAFHYFVCGRHRVLTRHYEEPSNDWPVFYSSVPSGYSPVHRACNRSLTLLSFFILNAVLAVLTQALPDQSSGRCPMKHYYLNIKSAFELDLENADRLTKAIPLITSRFDVTASTSQLEYCLFYWTAKTS